MANSRSDYDDNSTRRAAAEPGSRRGRAGWINALQTNGMRASDRRNERRVNVYASIWIMMLISTSFLKVDTPTEQLVTMLIFVLSAIPGLLLVKSYLRMLREADELLRIVQLEALAIGFGAGFVSGITMVFVQPPAPLGIMAVVGPMVVGFTARILMAGREAARDAAASDAGETVE